jgi:hypothetical protein
MEDYGFGATTYYFYIRSSNENLGDTTVNGVGTTGTYSDYGPSTGAASYTFTAPSGGTASISGSSTVGSTLTLTLGAPSASPAADGITIIWRRNDGGTGGNSFTGGSIMQTGGTTYVIDSPVVAYSSVGYSIRAEVTWNNGVGSQSANSNSVAVSSSLTKLATPTNVSATDNRTDGVNVTWSAVSGAAYYGVWYGYTPSYDSLADFGGNRNTTLITGTSYLDTSSTVDVARDYYVQAYRSGDPTGTKSDWGGPDPGTKVSATTTTTTTTTVNCSTCNSYSPSDGSYTYSATDPYGTCTSGSRYYRICVTPGACPNITEWGACVASTTTTTTTTTTNCNTCNSYAPSDQTDVNNPSNPCGYVGQCLFDGNTYFPAGC